MLHESFRVLEKIAGSVGAIAAFGYLCVRGHFNYLGVPLFRELSFERYLSETYVFILGFMLQLLIAGTAIALIIVAWRALPRPWQARLSPPPGCAPTLVLTWLIVLVLALILNPPESDVVVGRLQTNKLGPSNMKWVIEAGLLSLLIVGGLFFKAESKSILQGDGISLSGLWRVNLMMLIPVFVLLPIRYGSDVRLRLYPLASLSLEKSPDNYCGLLIYQSSENTVLWEAEKRIGRMHSFSTKSIKEIELGRVVDIVDQSKKAASSDQKFPDCKNEFGR